MLTNKEIQTRLECDENAWLKLQAQLGDFAREMLKLHERLNKQKLRLEVLENENKKREAN